MNEIGTFPTHAPNRPISSQRQPRAAINILESRTVLDRRTGLECRSRNAAQRNCPNGYLGNCTGAQTGKCAIAVVCICGIAAFGICTIGQLQKRGLGQLPACAIRGFNLSELYGTLVGMIRFKFHFCIAS